MACQIIAFKPKVPDHEEMNRAERRAAALKNNDTVPSGDHATRDPQPAATKWWKRSPYDKIIAGVIVAALIALGAGIRSYFVQASDAKITTEITKQLDQRRAQETENSNDRISAEVARQLIPIGQSLQAMNREIGKISQKLGIARIQIPIQSSPLQEFAMLDEDKFGLSVKRVADVTVEAQKSGAIDTIENIDAIQRKLVGLPDNSDVLRAKVNVINYASFVREKTGLIQNATTIRTKTCGFIKIGDGESPVKTIMVNLDGGSASLNGCAVRLDGLSIKNYTFENAVVRYDGGPLRLENVRFINCLFAVSLPNPPTPSAKQFANQILVNNVGLKPSFGATVATLSLEHPEALWQLWPTVQTLADAARDVRDQIDKLIAEQGSTPGRNPEVGLRENTQQPPTQI